MHKITNGNSNPTDATMFDDCVARRALAVWTAGHSGTDILATRVSDNAASAASETRRDPWAD